MKRELLALATGGLTIALSSALIAPNAMAQPATAEPKKSVASPLTIAELEKLIGGRTVLTLNLKDATLEEAAEAIGASSGLKMQPLSAFQAPPGMPAIPTRSGRRYSFEAKGEPFWEAFLAWQRAAIAAREAEPPKPEIVLTDGRIMRQPTNKNLPLFGVQQFREGLQLQPGTPLADGRSLAQWPYLMIGTRLIRTQLGDLAQTGLRPLDEPSIRLAPAANPKPLPADPKPTSAANRWQDGLKLDARVYLDPKIKASNLRCEVEEATDDKGNDLRPTEADRLLADNNSNRSYSDIGGGTTLNIAVHSQPNMGENLVKLRGNLRFSVLVSSQHLELTDLANGGARNLFRDGNNFSVDFGGLSNVNDDWQVTFKSAGVGNNWNDFFGSQDFNVLLVDDAGQTFPSTLVVGGETTHIFTSIAAPVTAGESPLPAAPNKIGFGASVTRSFDPARFNLRGVKVGRPVKIIVDLPIERREVVVPFEFTDLPLPPS